MDRPPARTLEQAVALHVTQKRGVRRHGAGLRLLLHQRRQVVKMKLVTPTGMLLVLLGQPLDESGTEGGMPSVIGADLALKRLDRPGLGTKGSVIPPLDSGKPEKNPFSGNGMSPLFGGQFLELGLKLAASGRCSQKPSDHAEPKMRPALMGPEG